jgi:hypothetical protein
MVGSTPRFRASAETRMAALRVRVLMAGHLDWQRTVTLLARLERLGRRAGATGITEFASSLRRELTATRVSQAAAAGC